MKTILFDCDGTLVDSEYVHYLGWKDALTKFDYDLGVEEYAQYVGFSKEVNALGMAAKIGRDCHVEILQLKEQHYRVASKTGMPPIVDTVDFLKRLAAQKESLGLKIGVCSAAPKQDLLSHLQHLQIEHLLDIILSGQDDLNDYVDPEGTNKPKPYIYLHAMKCLGVDPKDTIVIEDSEPGVLAGVAAGCFTIAIPHAYSKKQNFKAAHLYLESFSNVDISHFINLTL